MGHLQTSFCRTHFENAELGKSSHGYLQFDWKVHRLWKREAIVQRRNVQVGTL